MEIMSSKRWDFGYYPRPMQLAAGLVRITTLPDLDRTVADVESSEGVEKDWIYAPIQQARSLGGGVQTRPYPARIFGLPKTHAIEHAAPDSDDHLTFHLWSLSFFTGMRLTATEAGFVDATPIKPGKLVDFVPMRAGLEKSVQLAEDFWVANRGTPERARLWSAAVHALFLGQSPRLLQFEQFILLYTAFDACFALAKLLHPPTGSVSHAGRVAWMCGVFGMPVPAWADPSAPAGPEVAVLRDATLHEALFMGEPLGFALHGVGTNQNLTLEMEGLVSRFLVALIGAAQADYVRTSTSTRQMQGLDLP